MRVGGKEAGKALSLSLCVAPWSELIHLPKPLQMLTAGFTRERRLKRWPYMEGWALGSSCPKVVPGEPGTGFACWSF